MQTARLVDEIDNIAHRGGDFTLAVSLGVGALAWHPAFG
jgi:hypothetical protein